MAELFTESPTMDGSKEGKGEESVWTYRGYRLKTSEFVTAMVHLFRAEIQRANVWRQRLDTTTNWAVVSTGATLSIAFSQTDVHHGVIILNSLLVTLFLLIEARRYRYYELWSYRVRLMETDFYAAMLVPPFHPAPDWAESLAENLLTPSFPISMWEAFGRRLRRNYLWIYAILLAAWLAKTYLFPVPATNLSHFIIRAAVGPVPGQVMLGLGAVFYGALLLVAVATLGMTQASGEVLPRFGVDAGHDMRHTTPRSAAGTRPVRSLLHRRQHRQQFLATIITDKADPVGKRIMADLHRGVTLLAGKGMYTGRNRSVLMCALTVTEVHNLKAAVLKEDPDAFVIVSAAQEVLGRGFNPLVED
ncbi:MAG: DUF2270 domain-containing protein [Bacteroidota bacterium]